MTARQSHGVTLALQHLADTGCTLLAAAAKFGVDPTSLRRALRRTGAPPKPGGRPPTIVRVDPAPMPSHEFVGPRQAFNEDGSVRDHARLTGMVVRRPAKP